MPLSWNEIKSRALAFAREWADAADEASQAKPFWIAFFDIFGLTNKRVATFEHAVKKYGGGQGFVDLFWPGVLLVEQKSRGKSLDRAFAQAMDYFPGIKERDLPRYVVVCDFARFRLYDLTPPSPSGRWAGGEGEPGTANSYIEFALADLHKHVRHFAFIAGYETQDIKPQNPVNIQAAERMGRLHDALKASGYSGHALEVLLVRLLFCLFADDTGIFQPAQALRAYIEERTREDGSDLGPLLAQLFQVLNTPEAARHKNLDEQLAAFPYVNGRLFEEPIPIADFDAPMREALLDACALDWSAISPAIFGALFQSIMDDKARRNLGAHYTSEENIAKLIKPLFLDALWAEFQKIRNNRNRLFEFHKKLRALTFFDPACGCGNFLVVAYRELRLLELEVLRAAHTSGQRVLDVHQMIALDVDQFYGIEIEEFPAQIAQVALWLVDHQMNLKVSEEFGLYFARIPLKTSPHIVHGNALTLDWNAVLPAERCSYVMGNPPFVGAKFMNDAQRADTRAVFDGIANAGLLDFVAAWYVKAARYMQDAAAPQSSEGAGYPHFPSPHAMGRAMAIQDYPSPHGMGGGAGVRGKSPRDPALEARLKAYARDLRANATDAEQKLWYLLRDRRFFGFKFRRQHPVSGYILDFYCAEAKLAVELDGGQHATRAGDDRQRTERLESQGIRVLRLWNHEFLQNPEGALETLAEALGVLPSPPAPLPAVRGEGSRDASFGIDSAPLPAVRDEGSPRAAFVSTNSITQGEQVGVLWGWLLAQGVKIHFAHRTFQWSNEARGKAAVHCVIIGFHLPSPRAAGRGAGGEGEPEKTIYEYADIQGEPHAVKASNINPYLVDAPDVVLENRNTPVCPVPEIGIGNKPIDGGHYLFTDEEKAEFLRREPQAEKWFRRWLGADEFINGYQRWCLWLGDCPPDVLRRMPEAMKRVEAVRQFRLASKSAPTRKLAHTPTRFHVENMPRSTYLLIPRVSSERRNYIPIGFIPPDTLTSDSALISQAATLYHFGILTSAMHMAWMRAVCGRLESRYRYSAGIVYNNFPWPECSPSPQTSPSKGEGAKREAIEAAAQAVLDARAQFPGATLADLYDPLTMPPALLHAHQKLDAAVDRAYGKTGFKSDAERVAFLFARYQALTSLLPAAAVKGRRQTPGAPRPAT